MTTRRELLKGLLATGALALTPGGLLVPEEKRRRIWQVPREFSKAANFGHVYGGSFEIVLGHDEARWAPIDVPMNITYEEIKYLPRVITQPVTVTMNVTYDETEPSAPEQLRRWMNSHQHGVGPGPSQPPAAVKCLGDQCFCGRLLDHVGREG